MGRQLTEHTNSFPNSEPEQSGTSLLISAVLCGSIALISIAIEHQLEHWFVVPVVLCGTVIGWDAVEWCRARIDTFDPIALTGLLGWHFFFMAPILHVMTDTWPRYVSPPPDWRPWLGCMAGLNFVGLTIYRVVRSLSLGREPINGTQVVWTMSGARFFQAMSVSIGLCLAASLYVHFALGGYVGISDAFARARGGSDELAGKGWIMSMSSTLPVLGWTVFAVVARRSPQSPRWTVLVIAMLAFLAVRMLSGGLLGSRSNTVFAAFWAIAVIHYWIRPLSRRFLVVAFVSLVGFMYIAGFYKELGSNITEIQGVEDLEASERQSGRTLSALIVGDLGRADVQAYILFRIWGETRDDYSYRWGQTYLAAAMLAIPPSYRPMGFSDKVEAGTSALYGEGSFDPLRNRASNVYGLAGEAMLNFGPVGAVLSFVILGLAVRTVRRASGGLSEEDSRWLLIPFGIELCLLIMTSDFDNVVVFVWYQMAVPFLAIFASSHKQFVDGPC
jgi:hypothetical protein